MKQPNDGILRHVVERDPFRRELVTNCSTYRDNTLVDSYAYAYDAGGRPVSRNDDVFGYDIRDQVTYAAIDGNVYAHDYDGIGNHVMSGDNTVTNFYLNNCLNQTVAKISADGVVTNAITWNANGGMASDDRWTYAYDAEDQLVSVTSRQLTNGAVRVLNDYDYRHRRIRKTVQRYDTPSSSWHTSELRDFGWDDWNIIHEHVASVDGATTNVTEVQYFWGLDLSNSLQGAGGVGGLLAVSRDGNFYFPVYDNNGNVMKYLDESGSIVAAYVYDDFGKIVSQTGPLDDIFAFRFSTKYFDRENHTHVFMYRIYIPTLFSWLNRDPINELGGMNLYSFCDNGFGYDFLGLEKCCCKACLYSAIERRHSSPSEPLTVDVGLSGHTWLNIEECDTREDQWVDSDVQYSFGPRKAMENPNKNFLFGVQGGKWKVSEYNQTMYKIVKKCWSMNAKECKELKTDPAFEHKGSFSVRRYCTNTTLDLLRRHGVKVSKGSGPVQVGGEDGVTLSMPNPKRLAEQLRNLGGKELKR